MKKKYQVTPKDRKDWSNFTQRLENLYDKDKGADIKITSSEVRRLDLHGFSLDQANLKMKEFIIESYEKNCKKILVITGKGLRSKVYNNPYVSKKMNTLKYSVPQFIKNDQDLMGLISKISSASSEDGGDGAFYIFLKKRKFL